jgi:hypothetical protein
MINNQIIELPLFEQEREANSIAVDKIATTFVEVLNTTNPTTHNSEPVSIAISKSLDDLFPEQKVEEKNIQRAKEILGEIACELTQAQLKDTIVETQYLVNTWLDDFEREIFKGKTLKELLHDKEGL